MAIVVDVVESFDLVGDSTDLIKKGWATAEGTVGATSGRFGGQGYSLSSNDDSVLSKSIIRKTYTTATFYWINANAVLGAGNLCGLDNVAAPNQDPTININAVVTFNANGSLSIKDENLDVKVISPAGILSGDTWHHIEVQFTVANSGLVTVKVDGAVAVAGVGDFETLGGATYTSFVLYGDENTNIVDDITIQTDDTSIPPFLGDHKISVQFTDADTAQADWTGAYTDIDDPVGSSDGDTTYITSATLNAKSEFSLTNLSDTPTVIHAVQLVTEARKTDAGSRAVTPYLLSGSTREDGTEFSTSETYSTSTNVYQLNPDTSTAWTEATVNALILGVEITL